MIVCFFHPHTVTGDINVTPFHFVGIPRYYSGGSGLIQVESVNCLGSETNITACPHSTANTSDHSYDVGVKCQRGYISVCDLFIEDNCYEFLNI